MRTEIPACFWSLQYPQQISSANRSTINTCWMRNTEYGKKPSILNRQKLWIKIFLHASLNSKTTVFGDDYCQLASFVCRCKGYFSSVQFSRSVGSNCLRPHESQHARPPCPSPTPRVHPNSCASSRWCHPAISSSVVPFSSCPDIKEWDYFTFKILWLKAFPQLTFLPSLYTIHPSKYTSSHTD